MTASTPKERSKQRWNSANPDALLTWGRQLSGDTFVRLARRHFGFTSNTIVVEIGPGYGRILRSLLDDGVPFGAYLGVELSTPNYEWLKGRFQSPRIHFSNSSVDSVTLDRTFDVCLSSLTFKHFYPTFDTAITNLSKQAGQSGQLIFDLIEVGVLEILGDLLRPWVHRACGSQRSKNSLSRAIMQTFTYTCAGLIELAQTGSYGRFEADGMTYIRKYTKRAVRLQLRRAGWRLIAFDTVKHDARHKRLLVVARRLS